MPIVQCESTTNRYVEKYAKKMVQFTANPYTTANRYHAQTLHSQDEWACLPSRRRSAADTEISYAQVVSKTTRCPEVLEPIRRRKGIVPWHI